MDIEIRACLKAEIDRAAELFYTIRKEEFTWLEKEKIALEDFFYSTEGESIFVALLDGDIAGFISIWEMDNFIHNLFVSKEYRKSGVGKALIDYVISKYGKPLSLKCVAENKRALDFYLNSGWKIVGEGLSEEGRYYLLFL